MRSRRSMTVNIRLLSIGAYYETKPMATVPASSRGLEPLTEKGQQPPWLLVFPITGRADAVSDSVNSTA